MLFVVFDDVVVGELDLGDVFDFVVVVVDVDLIESVFFLAHSMLTV